MKHQLRIDELVRSTVRQAHNEAMTTKVPYYYPDELVRRVLGIKVVAREFANIAGGALELEVVFTRYIRALVGSCLQATKDQNGVRIWQSYHIPGRTDNRWLPAANFTPDLYGQVSMSYRKSGNANLGLADFYETMRVVALQMGYGPTQVIAKDYEQIVVEAKKRLAA